MVTTRFPNPEGQPLSLAPSGAPDLAHPGGLTPRAVAGLQVGRDEPVVSVVVAHLCSGAPLSSPMASIPEGFSRAPRDGAEPEGT